MAAVVAAAAVTPAGKPGPPRRPLQPRAHTAGRPTAAQQRPRPISQPYFDGARSEQAQIKDFAGTAAFDAYNAAFPLADGWENRVSLHQLAPLVVHAVKFGGSYRGATVAAVAGLR